MLRFADDIAILAENEGDLKFMWKTDEIIGTTYNMKIYKLKRKVMVYNKNESAEV